ncbi:MAG: hypothetical protein IIC13_15210 [SAR324 cluster bacterium]|nr:hypothetical protein [SAR324 cluster bacterium]
MLTPAEILKDIGQDRIKARVGSLMRLYRRVRARFPETYINATLLFHAVASYYADLHRLKVFHDTILANEYRKAAFIMKWITKIRPIQLERDGVVTKAHLLANEFFAIAAGLELLGDIKPGDISNDLLNRFAYNLHYRPINAETLTDTMMLLDKALKKEQP